ncbi:MAG: ABC transporter permease [Fimbriimonadaceae bacterium]
MLDPTDPLPASLFWALALASVAAVALLLYRTRPGLHLKATGEDPDKARQMGLKPVAIRYAALAGCGVLTGLSGALIYSSAGQFSGGMTAGQGYIALAAVIIGRWMPLPTLIACWMFGLFLALQIQLQGSNVLGYEIPSQFWNMLPYLATVIALAGLLGRMRPPAGLGKA